MFKPDQIETPHIFELLNDENAQFRRGYGMAGYAKRTLIALLKDFYRKPENTDGAFQYYPDDRGRATNPLHGIRIEDRFVYDRNNIDPRPALVVIRQSLTAQTKSLGEGFIFKDFRLGTSTISRMNNIDFTINAYSQQGDEAERLAEITFRLIEAYSAELRSLLGWTFIDPGTMGPETPYVVDSRIDYVYVPISISGQFSVEYTKTPKAKKLSFVAKCPDTVITDTGKMVTLDK